MSIVAMKCPGCGANIELDNSREFGFCNFCGTKVMQEKIIVEHKGKVEIDNSEYVDKFLQNARRAKQKGDWSEAEKYYNLVEQNDPQNIEAIFFSAYGRLRTIIVEDYSQKWEEGIIVLRKSISVLDDYFDMNNEQNCKNVIIESLKYIDDLVNAVNNEDVIVGGAEQLFSEVKTTLDGRKTVKNLAISLYPQIVETVDNIILKYKESNVNYDYLTSIKEKYSEKPKGGCYVATCVYGSYDCPQVWTLRRYRDNQLSQSWYGKAFIKTYYSISPTIVKWFGETLWFNKICRRKLDKMIEKLQSEGFENTPYSDK